MTPPSGHVFPKWGPREPFRVYAWTQAAVTGFGVVLSAVLMVVGLGAQAIALIALLGVMLVRDSTGTPAISLPERTAEALRRHRRASVQERLLAGPLWPAEWERLVFVTSNGTPFDPSNLRRMVAVMAKDAGIEGRVSPYDLRHTATSVLSAAGVAPELLADLLGHVDTRMVFKHYRHPVSPTIDVAAVNIERALEG